MALSKETHAVPFRPMSLRRSILVLGGLSVFGPLSMDLYMPALPQLADELGTSVTLAQATMSACMIGLGAGQLVNGPLSDRIGRRKPLVVSVAAFALLSLACAFAPNVGVLLVFRVLQGLAGSAGMVLAMAMARDMYSGSELSRTLSLLSLVSMAAPILAPVLGGQLVRFMDWRGIFLVLSCLGGLLFLVALLALKETLPPERRHASGLAVTLHHYGILLKDRLFIGIMIISGVTGTAFFVYLSMSSFVFQDFFGLTPTQFSLVFAGNSVAMLAGAQLNGLIVGKVGPRRMYIGAYTAEALATAVLVLMVLSGWGIAAFIPALTVYMFCSGSSQPNAQTLAMQEHGARAGTAASLMGVTMFVVGPIVGPLASLLGTTSLTLAGTMFVMAAIAATSIWLIVRPMLLRRGL